jgi:mannose/fructose-specific phosphotransferase system component IIA
VQLIAVQGRSQRGLIPTDLLEGTPERGHVQSAGDWSLAVSRSLTVAGGNLPLIVPFELVRTTVKKSASSELEYQIRASSRRSMGGCVHGGAAWPR